MTKISLYAGILATIAFCHMAAAENLEVAQGVVEQLHENLLHVMMEADSIGYSGRVEALDPALAEAFDFGTIARIVTGKHWKTLDEDQRTDFIKVFANLSAATYASNFNEFSGESFETLSVAEKRGSLVVKTVIVKADGEQVSLDYVLRDNGGLWQIVNVIADGVSDLSLKRSEYTAVIKSEGFNSLVTKLSDKIVNYGSKGQ